MKITDTYLERVIAGKEFLVFDGAMGTMLQTAGLKAGELPEWLCINNPTLIQSVHAAYVDAGAQVVTTNTFGASVRKLGSEQAVCEIYQAAVSCARASGARYVAADIGPTGALLAPLGTMDFDEVYDQFAIQAKAIAQTQADIVVIETMADLLEMKAAILAVKEHTDLPIFATMTFGEDGRTFLGTSPEIASITLSGLGVQALGINCSLGPDELVHLLAKMAPFARVPLMVQANAGLPQMRNGETYFDIGPKKYASSVKGLLDIGATVVGGCCGTTPEHIRSVVEVIHQRALDSDRSQNPYYEESFCICSSQRVVALKKASKEVAIVGERINPTGKPRLKEALRTNNLDYLVGEALDQAECGADILDVNVGLPEIDEVALLSQAADVIAAASPLPLQIDSGDPVAIERAVRRYSGKPLINSVNAKASSLEAILPIAAKYGCAVVGLTLDEKGIPDAADDRFALACRIVERAYAYGIPKEDIVIDCLTMAASTNQDQVTEILKAIMRVKAELGVRTTLGVSNISFGLPQREMINAHFLTAAFGVGLDLPILNPKAKRYRDAVATWRVLCAQDQGAQAFIEHYAQAIDPYDESAFQKRASQAVSDEMQGSDSASTLDQKAPCRIDGSPYAADALTVRHLILTGRKADMTSATEALLGNHEPLEVIDEYFIPVLDEVGAKFEVGEFFLPQLMASAEAVKIGFDVVKRLAPAAGGDKGVVALATVAGDIHDIGKNIVKMLLENYGYRVVDLGRDVSPRDIVDVVVQKQVHLVGLSALMTTTVRAMEETIRLLRLEAPQTKIMVGGAVLTPEYSDMVGADFYAKDAAEAARIAEDFFGA